METLRRRSQFNQLYRKGSRYRASSWVRIQYFFPKKDDGSQMLQCAWTLPKKVGNAVVRNRLKRWCREFFRKKTQIGVQLNVHFCNSDKELYQNLQCTEVHSHLEKCWKHITNDYEKRRGLRL